MTEGSIHGGKSKNDRIDSAKIANLLRGGTLPQAYVYPNPKGLRETRDLLRRRAGFQKHVASEPGPGEGLIGRASDKPVIG